LLAGFVSSLAGNSTFGAADGTGFSAEFGNLVAVALDTVSSIIYVSENSTHRVRAVTTDGVVTTVAGSFETSGFSDGFGAFAMFSRPMGITVDTSQSLFVADYGNQAIRKVSPSGFVSTLLTQAGSYFLDVALSSDGILFASEDSTHLISMIESGKRGVTRTVLAGNGVSGFADGEGSNAYFNYPCQIGFDSVGDLFVADNSNFCIRMITSNGTDLINYMFLRKS
jgi:sugar lactone lactonase YvrE